ncbi:MAG TPA: MFS transporter [Gammaproteobacteria bacterium]|nr:MFS transporter [Gammaproteobacteria bacterium]
MNKTVNVCFPIFLIIYELAVNLSNDMYLPAVSHMIQFFKTDNYFIQLTLTAWFAGAMAMNPLLGILSDHLGRKKFLLGSGFIFLMATLYCALPTNIYLFLFARFMQGVTVTSVVVGGYALIHEIYNDRQAIMMISWMSGALITAPMLGPLLGGYIIHLWGWRYIFLVLFLIATIALLGLYQFMPKIGQLKSNKINFKEELITYAKIIGNKKFIFGSLTYAFLFGGVILWIAASPFLILVQQQFTPLDYGFMQIPVFGSFILGIFLLKIMMRLSLSQETIIFIGIGILLVTIMMGMALLFQNEIAISWLVFLMSIYSLAFGLISSPINRITVTSLKYGMGKIMAMFDLIFGILATVATMLVNTHSYTLGKQFTCLIAVFIFLAIIVYFLQYKLVDNTSR